MKSPRSPAPPQPEDLFDPAHFPAELAWIPAHYKLHPTDPVYLLLAWHWRRVKQSEDTVQAALLELRAMLDARVAALSEAADTVADIGENLADVQTVLAEKPAELSAQIRMALTEPINQAIGRLNELEKTLQPIASRFRATDRRLVLATLLIGFALGLLTGAIALLL